MADLPVEPPTPAHSATSEILTGNPPTKRPASSTSAAAPPPKRHHHHATHEAAINKNLSSNSDDTKDTASSEPQKEDGIEQVEIPDDVVYQELDEHEFKYGINPVDDYDGHMQKFCLPYIHIGVGNQRGWEVKFLRLKNKFKNESAETVPPHQEEEFVLWKKMFARVPPDDAGSRVS